MDLFGGVLYFIGVDFLIDDKNITCPTLFLPLTTVAFYFSCAKTIFEIIYSSKTALDNL